MINQSVVFTKPWQVEVEEGTFAAPALAADEVVVKKLYTLISPGTELACLSGGESWFGMPGTPGYASVSEIVETGAAEERWRKGDIVFHYGDHSRYQVVSTRGTFLEVPAGLDLRWVPFTRMATVAATSIRVSGIELGDCVSVTGLGLIGNMAAQLAQLQGADVIGMDLSAERRRIAETCGLFRTYDSGLGDAKAKVAELTDGVGVSTHIEATGLSKVAAESLGWIAKSGELILLGSPRGEYNADLTDVLNYCHLNDRGCITFKGAHEWRFPVEPDPFVKHSMVRNSRIVFSLMQRGKLKIEPLISHVLRPEEAPSAYEGLRFDKDRYHGVLFDWRE
ncbi:zinc-binding alcohol dehydrogenase [Cohnella sp. GCM10012308]|uniref:zinc-dependent alcohol dehydrogenase n=1 Tax=Cohnella sp. GCM10012308 TaxID=3317329 RepID=UPI00361C9F1D